MVENLTEIEEKLDEILSNGEFGEVHIKDLTEEDEVARGKVVYVCKVCREEVAVEKLAGKYKYKCKECGAQEVVLATEESAKQYFKFNKK